MKGTKDYIFLSLLVLTICQSSYSQIYDQYISVSTDKYEYELDDPIQIVVSAFNPTASPITLSWPTACQATYWIDEYRVSPSVCATVITEITIPPYSSHSWEFTHTRGIYPVDIGPHSIRGEVIDYGISDPVTIMVSSPCVPDFSASPTTGEGASVTGVAEEFGEYAERTSSRVKAHRDNLIISESSLYVEGIPAPTKTWSITLQSPVGKKDGFLTPREFYYLLFHCQARRSKVDQAMTRGCGIDTAVIDSMPDGPKRHLQSIPYAWMGDPREGRYSSNVADQQSKMKSAVNNQVSNEIIIYEDEHYSLNPNLSLDRVHIPALKLP